MKYRITASSESGTSARIRIKESNIAFGITPETADTLPNPSELFLGSFASCMLKNVERFSILMKFKYKRASVDVEATRLEHPPRMDEITYTLTLYSNDPKINLRLLKKNFEDHGTIYNTVKQACKISGTIAIENV